MSDSETQTQGAMEAPPGVAPDFVHPYSLEDYILATQIFFLVVVAICVLMRMYTCLFIIRRFGVEEYACLASWPLAIAYSILIVEASRHGGGIHQWNVRKGEMKPYLKLIVAGELVYAVLVYLVKATILLLYLRLFGINRKTKWTIRGLLVVLFAYYFASIVAKSTTCIPLRKLWIPDIDGHCFENDILLLTDCAVSIISDLTILILPMPLIWDLRMPIRRKMELTAVFSLGIFACVSSIMRTYYTGIGAQQHDTTFNVVQVWLWTVPEVNCGLICGCIPILPVLIQELRRKLFFADESTFTKKSGFHAMPNFSRRRPLGTTRLNASDIELDEAGLIGHVALNSTKTSATRALDGAKIGEVMQNDQILKKIDLEQVSVKKTGDDR